MMTARIPTGNRWLGFLPEFRAQPLAFLEGCRGHGDVVFLPYGRIADWWLRSRDTGAYLLLHPGDIKHVLLTNQVNYPKREFPAAETALFGRGLLHLQGELHQQRRRLIMPALGASHHRRFVEIITGCAREALDRWMGMPHIELSRAMTDVTLAIIWNVLFHDSIEEQGEAVFDAILTAQEKVSSQYRSLAALLVPLWVPTPLNRKFSRAVGRLDEMVYARLARRKGDAAPRPDVASALMEARDEGGRGLQDREIRDELITLLLAGHETTANALEWAWILLADRPDVMSMLREEAHRVLGSREPTYEDWSKLRYARKVWDEVLRLFPPAWMLHTRRAWKPDRLPSGAHVPAGADVLLSPYVTQRDPRWFSRPNDFDPERWSETPDPARPAFAYFPFGGGARHCAGEGLAHLEGPLILAMMVQRADLLVLPGQSAAPQPLFTLRPTAPLWVRLQPIEGAGR